MELTPVQRLRIAEHGVEGERQRQDPPGAIGNVRVHWAICSRRQSAKRAEEMSKIGVMVCGHGSRDEEAIAEFAAVAGGIAQRLPQYPVEYGFLEFARPIIRDGLDALRGQGVTRCLAVPGMLFAAGHAEERHPLGAQQIPGAIPADSASTTAVTSASTATCCGPRGSASSRPSACRADRCRARRRC